MTTRWNRRWAERAWLAAALALAGACGGGGSGGPDLGDGGGDASQPSDGGDAGPSTITIHGTVIDVNSASPVAGASVFVTGASGVVTGVDGTFTVAGITPPYDVAVRAGGSNNVRAYRALIRVDPTLVADVTLPQRSASASGAATVSGTVAGDSLVCTMSGPRGSMAFVSASSSGTSPIPYSLTGPYAPQWYGPTSIGATLHCFLERFSGSTLVAAWHGSRAVTFADGGSFANQDTTLASVSLATVSGTFTDPDASGSASLTIGPGFNDGGGFYTTAGAASTGAFSVATALVPGGVVIVGARDNATLRQSSTVVPAASAVTQDVTLLSRPSVTAPSMGATGVAPTTPVTWNGGAAHLFRVYVSFSGGASSVEVVTTGSSVVLPDLATFGLAYPAGGSATVRVVEYGIVPSVDEAANGMTLLDMMNERGTYQVARSASVTFNFVN